MFLFFLYMLSYASMMFCLCFMMMIPLMIADKIVKCAISGVWLIKIGFAIAVMEEIGIDINTHQPKSFEDLEFAFYDVIISFSPEAHEAAVALTQSMDCETLYWPIDNLANLTGSRDERLRAYRHVRDVIQGHLEHYLGKPITVKT